MNKPHLITPHLKAVVQALFVTFLWSTSWVIIKVGLKDIPALTFAGLRYSLAFFCLIPFALRSSHFRQIQKLSRKDWLLLSLLGILFYAVTQGAQFLGLVYLPAVTASVLLNSTSLFVAVLGILLLDERPTPFQWYGIGLFILGVVFYFFPIQFPAQQLLGILIVMIGVLANAFSSILGRAINRTRVTSPLLVTIISMGIGSMLLLIGGIGFQGLPGLSLTNWLYIAWLAVVNTAFAFTLWNHTLQELTAMESTIINGTMLIQIAVLAWIFLGEELNTQKIIGMLLAGAGAVLVQYRRKVGQALAPEPDISTD